MMKLFKLFWILLFFVGAIIPLCHINEEKISEWENRTLAKFPKIVQDGKVNKNYGSDFEKWLNDRFGGRDKLIHFYEKAQFINHIFKNEAAFLVKDTGWMFNVDQIPQKLPSSQKTKEIEKQIRIFFDFCEANGIKLYVLVVPDKALIYSEKYRGLGIPDRTQEYLNSVDNIVKAIDRRVIFPFLELKQLAAEDLAFFKESHHWTDRGAYIGYEKLIEVIKKDFKDIKIISLDDYKTHTNIKIRDDWWRDFNTGHTTALLHIKPKYAQKHLLRTNYTYYDPPVEIKPQILDISKYKIKSFKNLNPKAKYKVFLSGFSHNENLLQFLPYSFAELKYYRLNNVIDVEWDETESFLKRYKEDLLAYKPDILILTITNRQLFSEKLWSTED